MGKEMENYKKDYKSLIEKFENPKLPDEVDEQIKKQRKFYKKHEKDIGKWVEKHETLVKYFEANGAGKSIFGNEGNAAVNKECRAHGYRLKKDHK